MHDCVSPHTPSDYSVSCSDLLPHLYRRGLTVGCDVDHEMLEFCAL
jgi:hypothetical protein